MVSTHLKNISQNWNPAQVGIGMKIKNTVFETTIQYIIHSMGYPTETLTQITSAILLDVRSRFCLSVRLPYLLRHDDNENNDDPGGCGIIYIIHSLKLTCSPLTKVVFQVRNLQTSKGSMAPIFRGGRGPAVRFRQEKADEDSSSRCARAIHLVEAYQRHRTT